MTRTVISASKALEQLNIIKEQAKEATDKKLREKISLLGLNPDDPDIKGIVSEMRKYIQYETQLEQAALRKMHTKEGVNLKEVIEKLENIRRNLQFLVTCAYMKKQEKVNANLLRLNRFIVGLTVLVVILMILQATNTPVDKLIAGLSALIVLICFFLVTFEFPHHS